MSEPARQDALQEVVCPHCRKPFAGELLTGSAARYRGFKCPHCKLFVPESVGGTAGSPHAFNSL